MQSTAKSLWHNKTWLLCLVAGILFAGFGLPVNAMPVEDGTPGTPGAVLPTSTDEPVPEPVPEPEPGATPQAFEIDLSDATITATGKVLFTPIVGSVPAPSEPAPDPIVPAECPPGTGCSAPAMVPILCDTPEIGSVNLPAVMTCTCPGDQQLGLTPVVVTPAYTDNIAIQLFCVPDVGRSIQGAIN